MSALQVGRELMVVVSQSSHEVVCKGRGTSLLPPQPTSCTDPSLLLPIFSSQVSHLLLAPSPRPSTWN